MVARGWGGGRMDDGPDLMTMTTAAHDLEPGRKRATVAALGLIGVLLLQGLLFIRESSQTSDEGAHLLAGYTYLTTGNFRADREEPPLLKEIAALALLPLGLDRPVVDPDRGRGVFRLGSAFVHENRISGKALLTLARLPILAMSAALGWLIFFWGRQLFGSRGALLALSLYALDPNVVAHSCLVTTDLGVTLFMCLTLWAAWRWARRPHPRALILIGLGLGATLASKPTGWWAVTVLGALGLALALGGGAVPSRPWSARSATFSGGESRSRRLAALGLAAAITVLIAGLTVATVCGFVGVPDYLAGLGRGLSHSAAGSQAYLMGHVSSDGWWYYFLFAFLVKTPPGTLVIMAAGAVSALLGRRMERRDEIVLGVPVLLILVITAFWRVNIGLRHLLPIYPLLFLSAGRVMSPAAGRGSPSRAARIAQGLVLACLLWNATEAFAITPHQLAYFNRFAGGPRTGHLLLLDSNLDWGQSSNALRRFMAEERIPMIYCAFTGASDPRYYGVTYQYVPGVGNFVDRVDLDRVMPQDGARELLAVSAMALHFVHLGRGTLYDWLRDRPVIAMPGYSYLVYDITGDANAHMRLAQLYEDSGLPHPAIREAQRALRLEPGLETADALLRRLAR